MEKLQKDDAIRQVVIDYLTGHPDFLRDHPDLLARLELPHPRGTGVISLIERQISVLRNQLQQLQQRLAMHQRQQERRQTVFSEVYAATREIVAMRRLQDIYLAVSTLFISRQYADHVRLYLFSDMHDAANQEGLIIMKRTASLKFFFIELLNRNLPLCGSLQEEHINALFRQDAAEINSTLLFPLAGLNCEGILALGSHRHGRYGQGDELEILRFLVLGIATAVERILTPGSA